MPLGEAPAEVADLVGDDPLAAFDGARTAFRSALPGPGGIDGTIFLSLGDIPTRRRSSVLGAFSGRQL